jgi:hypothetical protein
MKGENWRIPSVKLELHGYNLNWVESLGGIYEEFLFPEDNLNHNFCFVSWGFILPVTKCFTCCTW